MNIHEYQAKQLLDKFGVNTPPGDPAFTAEEAEKIANKLATENLVIKAQVHAGGRGKGTFKNGFKGGVHLCKTPKEAGEIAKKMIGETLVTHQTGEEGRVVRKVLVAQSVEIDRELYFAILIDRATKRPTIVASTKGGMDIEAVAEEDPGAIISIPIHPALGLLPFQTRNLAKQLGLSSSQIREASKLFEAVYNLFIQSDCSLVEINPLVVTKSGEILAIDAKLNFDDNALFRQKEISALRDLEEEDPREVQASKFGLNYIGLDGNIGCMVNGAGLAMGTMDIIHHYGGEPANFLDVGGGANEEQVAEAFKILVGDPKVHAILINIFGGIMKCDVIAQGIINALKIVKCDIPLVVRLEGTNVEMGKKLLQESGLALVTADDAADAAQKVVQAAKEIEGK